ncbi:cobalamin ABC transporter substrate-binding protein [Ectothiorhodospiraceae bacterium BW-2]|nr:cobalamin ABC transporter substrate-binding protein [Ectothiorhodospiraceae bacterium BW-2]
MRRKAAQWLPLLALLMVVGAVRGEVPQRVVSVNLCSDQLLLLLADAEQIAAVSYLVQQPQSSLMAATAARFQAHRGRVEEILARQPDLVLAHQYSSPQLLQQLRQLGIRVEIVAAATTIEAIRATIEQVAHWLGTAQRGQRVSRALAQRLSRIVPSNESERVAALFFQPDGYTTGRDTLQHTALELAGWRNVAADLGVEGYAPIALEHLVVAEPSQIFTSRYGSEPLSRAELLLQHPALRRLMAGRQVIDIDYRYWICATPQIAEAIEQLYHIRRERRQ